jgi:hypothetical protein
VPYQPIGRRFQRGYNLLRRLAERFAVDVLAVRHKRSTHQHRRVRPRRGGDDPAAALASRCRSTGHEGSKIVGRTFTDTYDDRTIDRAGVSPHSLHHAAVAAASNGIA